MVERYFFSIHMNIKLPFHWDYHIHAHQNKDTESDNIHAFKYQRLEATETPVMQC